MARVQLLQMPLEAFKRRLLAARSQPGVIRAILGEYRERLLVDMANWQRGVRLGWRFPPESHSVLETLRDELRQVWSLGTSKARRQAILDKWLSERPRFEFQSGFRALAKVERLDLRRQLVLGVLAERRRFAICANPACSRSYFLRRRSTQVFCCSECAETRQREHKRRSWAKHGQEWRRKYRKRKKSRSHAAR